MAGLAQPSTYSMDATAPPYIISMDAAGTPSTSIIAAPMPPSTSPTTAPTSPSNSSTAVPAQPSNSPTAGSSQPSNFPTVGPVQPSISSMSAPTPPSTSTMAVTGEARKKRLGHEFPRSGCKKKKIAPVQEEPRSACKKKKKIAPVQEEPRSGCKKKKKTAPVQEELAKSTSLFSKDCGELPRGQYVSKICCIEAGVIGGDACFCKKGKVSRSSRHTCFTADATTEHPFASKLSPAAGTSSHGSKRRRRKLVSNIWEEAEPIYHGRMLVEGRCNRCQQIFPATRDNGTSHLRRHLKKNTKAHH